MKKYLSKELELFDHLSISEIDEWIKDNNFDRSKLWIEVDNQCYNECDYYNNNPCNCRTLILKEKPNA